MLLPNVAESTIPFLKSLNLNIEKRKFFLFLHRQSLSLNNKARNDYISFYNPNLFSFAGGCIRDLLLKDVDSVKDLDILVPSLNYSHIKDDLLLNPISLNLIKQIFPFLNKDEFFTLNNFGQVSFNISKSALIEEDFNSLISSLFINYKFHPTKTFFGHARFMFLITDFINKNFVTNNKYNLVNPEFYTPISNYQPIENNTETNKNSDSNHLVDGLSVEPIFNSYGSNVNNLLGVIKSNINFSGKDYPVDFLINKNKDYFKEDFDLSICKVKFPYYSDKLYLKDNNFTFELPKHFLVDNFRPFEKFYQNEFDYLDFIEENIDNYDLFIDYLSRYLLLTDDFLFSALHKTHCLTNLDEKSLLISLKKHYPRIYEKYPYPLIFINSTSNPFSITELIKKNNLDIELY